jgi:hypothetical protein
MAFFETSRLKDQAGNVVNPADNDSITLLRRILLLLKPLGQITGAGSNRLSIDVNTLPTLGTVTTVTGVTTVSTVTTVTGVTTVNTVTNQAQMGGVAAFELMKAMSRDAYANGIRSKLQFS